MNESSAPAVLSLLLCCLVPVTAVIGAVVVGLRGGGRRRQQAAQDWQRLMLAAQANPAAQLCHLQQVYQRARTGAKAIIVWDNGGLRQDTWFWGWHPAPGSTLLVHGGSGYGPHNHNPNVFYVAQHDVVAAAGPGALQAWRQQQQSKGG